MAEVKTSGVVIAGRFSYLHYHERQPAKKPGQKEKYGTAFLVSKKDTETVKKLQAIEKALIAQAKEKMDGKFVAKNFKGFLKDGDEEKPGDLNYAGKMFFSAYSDSKPDCVDADLNPIIEKDEIYSGMYGRISADFYLYGVPDAEKTEGGRGIGVGLNNIQKLKDGPAFSSKTSAKADFGDVEDEPYIDESDSVLSEGDDTPEDDDLDKWK